MSVKTTQCHYVRCDYSGCEAEVGSEDGGELHFESPERARDAAQDDEWLTNVDGNDYCLEHWASDDGEQATE